jgi:hypothetical protein
MCWPKLMVMCMSVFLACTPLWFGYNIQYFDGIKKTEQFTQKLDKDKVKYKVIKRLDNIYEVQYKGLQNEDPDR